MTENPGDALRRAAADQAALDALPAAEREAEMQRRAELFKQKHSPAAKRKAKFKGWLVIAGLLVVAFFALRLIGGLIYGDTTKVNLLDTGDCINFPADDEETERVETPDCSEPHEGQIYHDFGGGNMTSGERQAECLSELDAVDLRVLGMGDDFSATVGNFSAAYETGRITETFCWVRFPSPVSGSVVDS